MNWWHQQQQQQQQHVTTSTTPTTPTRTTTTTTTTSTTNSTLKTAAKPRPSTDVVPNNNNNNNKSTTAAANSKTIPPPLPSPVKLRPHPIASSVVLLSLLCLLVINWARRFNISSLLSFHTLSSYSSYSSSSSSSSLSALAAANPIQLYYPDNNDQTTTNSTSLIPPSITVTNDTMRCIIYDRPPRTGSTTVYKYLDRCLAGHGYGSSLRTYRGIHDHFLLDHFNNNTNTKNKKSLITRHLTVLPFSSLQTTLSHCTLLLYITSTRPIRERLLSKLKYELPDHNRPGQIIAEKRRKVDASALRNAMRERLANNVSSLFPAEMYYESFPAISPQSMASEVGSKFVPDYVIRSNRFMSDFKALLKALKCSTKFQGANVHRVVEEEEENGSGFEDQQLFLDAVPVAYGDARYRALAKLAARTNERGLRKAAMHF